MKLLHISDLHLGKRVFEMSMMEEQRAVLDQVVAMAARADATIIAGDVYDRQVPPAEAVALFGRVVIMPIVEIKIVEKSALNQGLLIRAQTQAAIEVKAHAHHAHHMLEGSAFAVLPEQPHPSSLQGIG